MFKMVAVRQFDGLEGFKNPGDEFEVERKDRAEALNKANLARFAKNKLVKAEKKEALGE